MYAMNRKLKLGDLLLSNEVISVEQLDAALKIQNESGKKLGHVLIELGFIDEIKFLQFLAKQLNLPFLDLNQYTVRPEVIRELPESFARRYLAIPIDRIQGGYLVAISDPTDLVAYDEVARKLKKTIRLVVVRESDLIRIVDEVYRRADEIATLVGELEQEMESTFLSEEEDIGDAPIKKLLNSIFEDAVQVNASDIHIEPAEQGLRIRLRIDGILHEQIIAGKNILSALILRLKLMGKLNISERRLPQEGRFSLSVKGKKIDIRISTMPVKEGESAVLRLLFQTGIIGLEGLGLEEALLSKLKQYLVRTNGVILVTGPTGSGKSTTLYSALKSINTHDKKIITVEDPVEYAFDRINQIQVQPKIGLDFSTILRSCLRQDPDIIMVGEIRDEETAQIALRAAMTGHLVLSTLHTNDALSTLPRLIDMGIEPYLAASTLRLIIAQRLARRNCLNCKETYQPAPEVITWLHNMGCDEKIKFHRGKGCSQCGMRGYKGRIGIFEMLEISKEMNDALRLKKFKDFHTIAKKQVLYQPLIVAAFACAKQGIINADEIIRLSAEIS